MDALNGNKASQMEVESRILRYVAIYNVTDNNGRESQK